MKRIIAIVAGGDRRESRVARSAATILKHMDRDRYEPYLVEIERSDGGSARRAGGFD